MEQACEELNRLQAIAATDKSVNPQIERVLREVSPLMGKTQTALLLDRDLRWSIRPVADVKPGQRVEIVGTQDPALLDHVGKMGVVMPFRAYSVPGSAKVRIDGYAVDMVWPLGCLKVVVSPVATRLDSLKEQYEALLQRRQHVLAQGEIIKRKPEIFPTVKKSRKVCGNVQSKAGVKGYAFLTVVQNGHKKRFAIPPSELGRYEAAYARGLEVRRIDRELKKLTRLIDRQSAIANGARIYCAADSFGKQAGQLDLYCTRDGRSPSSGSGFSFVVFRWQPKADGKGLKRSNALKRFDVAARATPEQIEAVRQKAIAFMSSLQ
ncbi:MAG: hypothetical protein SNJ50_17395 [Cyanobacteriota bacterium]